MHVPTSSSSDTLTLSQSALERGTGYSKKAARLFPSPLWLVLEPTDTELDAAWAVMQQLQDAAENCCSTAAKFVNRNCSEGGVKKKPMRPLR
jgi:hypothetical protein